MKGLDFIAIDFETANEQVSSVCALGIVIVENGKIIDKKYRLIRPHEYRFNWQNIQVHGIKPEETFHEPTFKQFWKSIHQIFENKHIIAHNAAFDTRALTSVLDIFNLEYPTVSYNCTVKIARRAWPGLGSYKLNLMGQRLGIKFRHHQALDDAIVCAEIMLAAAKETNSNTVLELLNYLQILPGKISPTTCFPDKALRIKHAKTQTEK